VQSDLTRIRQENGLPADTQVPVDAVTASGSGLDPHISPAYADLQVPRVAAVREMTEDELRALVDEYTDGSLLGVAGEPRVNVLLLNLALDDR
jgi:K+-transporting ATPase ATPase C chain